MKWDLYRSTYDTLAGQLADLGWDLLRAEAEGQLIDDARHAEPRTPAEVSEDIWTAMRHLGRAANALRGLAITEPIRQTGTRP